MPSKKAMAPGLERFGKRIAPKIKVSHEARDYWNAGVNQAYRRRLPLHRPKPGMENYYNAGVNVAYGNLRDAKLQLGDLFNDIMGAVVPAWDSRPDWMKKLVVKPDPAKIISAAQKVAPNAAGQIVGAAERAGLNVFVNTPAGQVPVTPGMAQSAYAGFPMFAQAQQTLGAIPTWIWFAVPGGILALMLLSRG